MEAGRLESNSPHVYDAGTQTAQLHDEFDGLSTSLKVGFRSFSSSSSPAHSLSTSALLCLDASALMEVQKGATAVPQPHARTQFRSPPPHLRDFDNTARSTGLLNRLGDVGHKLPSSADTPSHLATLLSFLEPDSSTSSPSLPARQLAYIEALAALSPHDASGWDEQAAQGVVWTKEALELLVEVLEKVGTGTTADLGVGEGGSDCESVRKDALSARVASWLEGIAEHVARQVRERKDGKGKGKAVEGCVSLHFA